MNVLLLWLIYCIGVAITVSISNRENAILWVLMWILFELMKISDKTQ